MGAQTVNFNATAMLIRTHYAANVSNGAFRVIPQINPRQRGSLEASLQLKCRNFEASLQ